MTDALTQAEAEALLKLEKHATDNTTWRYPAGGGHLNIPLVSADRKEDFLLDIWRSGIAVEKGRYQNRAHQVLILARLDFGGAPHRNPDGEEIGVPHLHLYREGYGDKWAYVVDGDDFPDVTDRWRMLEDFMTYCNVTVPPDIPPQLFA